MKAVKVGAQPGLEHLQVVELSEPKGPARGEIRVRIHASSLNYHDYGVAKRGGPKHAGRILMADGAGVVEVVGEGVTEFKVRLQGLIVGSRLQQQQMVRGIDATAVRPVIDRRFPLEGLADAFRYQESREHFGKICIEF
jgi:NADPH:quinone reductase-like Zn-dependent oxidoreductase